MKRTIEQRLDAIELKLTAILNAMGASADKNASADELIAQGKARGLTAKEMLQEFNLRNERAGR